MPKSSTRILLDEVAAVVVLLNGKDDEAITAASYVKLGKDGSEQRPLISDLPVFVGWAPYRNVHGALKGV